MTARYSREDVELALAAVAEKPIDEVQDEYQDVLAAEVKALREELEAARALAALHAADAKKTREELETTKYSLEVAKDKDYEKLVRDFIEAPVVDDDPRYSTEAVDALLEAWSNWDCDSDLRNVAAAIEAVRASRDPKL